MSILIRITIFLALTCRFPAVKSQILRNCQCNRRDEGGNDYRDLLEDIQRQKPFNTMLVIHDNYPQDCRLQVFYQYPQPKVVLTKFQEFPIVRKYNAEVVAVIIMSNTLHQDIIEAAAKTLDHIRQTRILVIAIDINDPEQFKADILKLCQSNKMTNVLLNFHRTNEGISSLYYILKPYPEYSWQLKSLEVRPELVSAQHWRNMHQAPLITYTGQIPPQSLVTTDAMGNLKINGNVARMVMLFAERYNASLKMYKPLKVGEFIDYASIGKLVNENQLDIPMILHGGSESDKLLTQFYSSGNVHSIVPCAQSMQIKEIFGILLNEYFFGNVIVLMLLLSILHSLVDYLFHGLLNLWNFLFSDKILPGVLGQSFVASKSPWLVLKIIYFLLFFAGLNITTQFSANMNTLFTSPPQYPEIKTFADLVRSPVKLLIDDADSKYLNYVFNRMEKSIIRTNNTKYVFQTRSNFDTTYGYVTQSWDIITRQQQFFTHKLFCAPKAMTFFDFIIWTFQLQPNSPFLEPMNELIGRVHELGLLEAWTRSTFLDMVKLKIISIRDPNSPEGAKVLNTNDLYWVWMIIVIGLAGSTLVFVVELLVAHRKKLLK